MPNASLKHSLFLAALIAVGCSAFAETTNSAPTSAPSSAAQLQPTSVPAEPLSIYSLFATNIYNFLHLVFSSITSILLAFVAATGGALVHHLWEHKRIKREVDARIKQFFLSGPKMLPRSEKEKKVSTLVVGLGGSGKTSLINRLTTCDNDRGHILETKYFKKATFCVHEGSDDKEYGDKIDEETKTKERRCTRFYYSDYRGQDFSCLVRSMLKEQVKEQSPFKYGDIEAVVFVVDLLDPNKHSGVPDVPSNSVPIDEARVTEHINEWNTTALDAVFGMLTQESLRFVGLFVNKCNLVKMEGAGGYEAVEKKFAVLIDSLKRRLKAPERAGPYAKFAVILGAAGPGKSEGVSDLQDHLASAASPFANEDAAPAGA